jgi:hypothetical protein
VRPGEADQRSRRQRRREEQLIQDAAEERGRRMALEEMLARQGGPPPSSGEWHKQAMPPLGDAGPEGLRAIEDLTRAIVRLESKIERLIALAQSNSAPPSH